MRPSIKTIEARLGEVIKHEHGAANVRRVAQDIRELMNVSTPREIDQAMDALDTLLCGYGVETISDNGWRNYWLNTGLLYVNMGDTYAPTVVYDIDKGRFDVCSWGDIVEADEKRFNI